MPASTPEERWYAGFVFFDLECTGLSKTDVILEIGAVSEDGGVFDVKLRLPPDVTVHPEAARVNGYNPEEWEHAMDRAAAFSLFEAFIEGRCVVGHNIWRYDFNYLRRELGEERARKLLRASIDTYELAKVVHGPSSQKSLHALCERYGIEPEGVHRALGGATRVRDLFHAIVGRRDAAPVQAMQRLASEF